MLTPPQDVGNSINPAIDYGQIEGAFVQGTGARRLEGCYLETDELLSRLRILARARA